MLGAFQSVLSRITNDPQMFVIDCLLLVVAITLHEFGHAVVATSCGDPTPGLQGRVTLNPLAHLDPMGTIGMFFFGFGWGKPVMVSPGRFRHRWDHVKVAAAGPFMNAVQGMVFGLALRSVLNLHLQDPVLTRILSDGMMLNVGLMAFNLIPVGPLDGATILKGFLPLGIAYDFEEFNRQWGMLVMFLLIFSGYVGVFIAPVERLFTSFVLGRGLS